MALDRGRQSSRGVATPGIGPEVDRLLAEVQAEFGDRTIDAIEALSAGPGLPDPVRAAVAGSLLPAELLAELETRVDRRR
ncbi:MAG: hypothetical protein IPK26_02625 [Planctomycetes bacterium]|nr:hypothetical protein [Planctomycetota bacterium]